MLNKDFEDFDLRLVKLREQSSEDFDAAEKLFDERYKLRLEEIFPRDVLGVKKYIGGNFAIAYVDELHAGNTPDVSEVFKQIVPRVISSLPLNKERQDLLIQNILQVSELSEPLHSYFQKKEDISRDPFFALVEDFSIDGDISKEEFLLLQQSYERERDFLKALESLPDAIRDMFHSHIALALSTQTSDKRGEFESEFSAELKNLQDRGINIEPVVMFVSRSFYKTPGKFRKYEHPKRRMRRTFKIALLRLLRMKLGNIDAQIMLERFEVGENFEDFFMLLFKLLEVVDENPDGKELFILLNLDEDIGEEVFSAEENKKKILAGESLVMRIASLFSHADAKSDEQKFDDGMLEKILEENTDIVGEDVYFNREDENAGIYAQVAIEPEPEEEIDYDAMSPAVAYKLLKYQFHKVEEEKRNAFGEGRYDDIDTYNNTLLSVQSKLEKLSKLLGEEL